ncbi:Cas1p-domain-containing protein [Amylostereum chailletii]|nr:Cas1p-domain-containing protein [Amylostereum chailletii]
MVRLSYNTEFTHTAALLSLALGLGLGLLRFLVLDRFDPSHCDALVSTGRWLDSAFKTWQPDGCMTHTYKPNDAQSCLKSRSIVFIGDSVTRKLFFQFANILDSSLPVALPNDDAKHTDHALHAPSSIDISFFWDPFLNSTHMQDILSPSVHSASRKRPGLLVIGSGLWYLRYAESSGGLPAWQAKMEFVLETLAHSKPQVAESIVVLPIEDIIEAKLSTERAATMLASDRDAMNSELYHRVHPPSPGLEVFPQKHDAPIVIPMVFNDMLDPSQTEDGLHFVDSLVRTQANILLNHKCNNELPKTFPLDKTCCRSYPQPSVLHLIVLALIVLWGPYSFILSRRYGPHFPGSPLVTENQLPSLVVSGAIALIYLADRTSFWLKEHKHFNPWTFAFTTLSCLALGLVTVKRADKDLGFLNREQSDEWKGWMQIAILIYHYFGASKISGIYNPIRVLVASYLFMTGYGHTTYYIKKAEFGFLRVAQILTRINLFTLFLAYAMNTDYVSYYFSPLVSMWYLIIYATMAIGSQYNERAVFLIGKIVASMAFMTWFMSEHWLLEGLFELLETFCGIHWSAKEWAFRVNLDLWIVYVGMLAAVVTVKLREHRLTDHPQWPLIVKASTAASAFVILWFFTFELTQPTKFAYNAWHPYISFLPVLAFVVLRNANAILRSATSRAFAFIGRCSLETFIIQYHLWLAADTKGILIVIPWTRWRSPNMVITAAMFILVSHYVALATGEITSWICGTGSTRQSLPTTTAEAQAQGSSRHDRNTGSSTLDGEPPEPKDEAGIPMDPPTPRRPRWVDRLAEGSSSAASPGFRVWYGETEWQPGVEVKVAIGFGVMWLVNMLWSYPPPT